MTFPRPPVAGTETIVPITTPEELIREGWSQPRETLEAVRDWMACSTGLPPAWTLTPKLKRVMERAMGRDDLVF